MNKWAILITNEDGRYQVIGPFASERAAESAQRIIESLASVDTQIIEMEKFQANNFSIYS